MGGPQGHVWAGWLRGCEDFKAGGRLKKALVHPRACVQPIMAAHGLAMARRRNKWGTLEGGQQNESIQRYVLEESMKEKEHKRWLAHKQV